MLYSVHKTLILGDFAPLPCTVYLVDFSGVPIEKIPGMKEEEKKDAEDQGIPTHKPRPCFERLRNKCGGLCKGSNFVTKANSIGLEPNLRKREGGREEGAGFELRW